jgi:hypothetical protein
LSGADAAADERTDHWPTETIRYTQAEEAECIRGVLT